jgi:hypothetical protein
MLDEPGKRVARESAGTEPGQSREERAEAAWPSTGAGRRAIGSLRAGAGEVGRDGGVGAAVAWRHYHGKSVAEIPTF